MKFLVLSLALVVVVAAVNAQYAYNMCVTSLSTIDFCNCATLYTDCPGLPNAGKQDACYTRCRNYADSDYTNLYYGYTKAYWKRACNCSRCQLKCESETTAAAGGTTAATAGGAYG